MDWMPRFLDAIATGSTVSEAARFAGISSATAYQCKARDADFAEAFRLAREDRADILESEARRRAIDGVDEPVVHKGEFTPVFEVDADGEPVMRDRLVTWTDAKTGEPRQGTFPRPVQARNPDGSPKWLTVNRKSDALLTLLLKGERVAYGTERRELTGAEGKPLLDDTARRARLLTLIAGAQRDDDEPLA